MGDTLLQLAVEIPQTFQQFVDGALLRLQAQHPHLRFTATESGVEVQGVAAAAADEIRRQVSYAVYREKVYAETLPLRQNLINAVTAR
ncbi:hypothetical protein RFM98_25135 [Mesorhizobium sp. VK9D]|uniref:hypothetical protein n=1 Tax=Mesorhizobium australafricanum TaxID=3072311 RepID=UPI002A248F78|nr:hypothetical protein [Mesorhizobium sp. VK9D]MDX8456021.1 hypothetical protein [Mesorhizobium sp. VK9D]